HRIPATHRAVSRKFGSYFGATHPALSICRKPWIFGDNNFLIIISRYSCQHSHFSYIFEVGS
ncbi:hypothetical protein, partial [Pedobacter sp.]|uniref:hypothetical protein n=1 Tax=Pedobacter sp. TaxID=1411316 RepID=UPI003D7FEF54